MVSLSLNESPDEAKLGRFEDMISIRWLEKRRTHWLRLEELVNRSSRGIAALSHSELQELGLLYRQTASDLATVREDATNTQLANYLNQLLARSHNLLYMGRKREMSGVLRFYKDTYPSIFRKTLPQTALSVAIFMATALAGWVMTIHDPAFAHRLIGPQMMESIERREMWTHSIVTIKPVASSAIMTNNLSVAFTTFALGITAGIGTIWMIILNGLLIGVIGAATWQSGMAVQFWSFVAPHGVLELPAIFIASGAGLEIARGLLFPGLLPRKASLAQAGGRAAQLLLGTIPLLVIAGVIEGFFSPSDAPAKLKFLLAGVLFAALLAYLFQFRRPMPEQPLTAHSAP
jgi:uncharacterized membrane protein SpoIIM required for sporulation